MQLSNFQVDLIAGIFAGTAGTIVAHPLDTIKVRIQSGGETSMTIRTCLS